MHSNFSKCFFSSFTPVGKLRYFAYQCKLPIRPSDIILNRENFTSVLSKLSLNLSSDQDDLFLKNLNWSCCIIAIYVIISKIRYSRPSSH